MAALLWYKTLKKDLENVGFVFNPYDSCVCNRLVDGKQQTVRFHVDDLISSHENPKVNDEFYNWLNEKYGGYGKVKSNRGKIHDYLGMKFDFTKKGHVKIDMSEYIEQTIKEFREKGYKLDGTSETLAGNDLFSTGSGEILNGRLKDDFHTFVAKGLFAAKRARRDIQPTIAVLTTRVKEPTEGDWKKLIRLMKYLNGTSKMVLTLLVNDLHVV